MFSTSCFPLPLLFEVPFFSFKAEILLAYMNTFPYFALGLYLYLYLQVSGAQPGKLVKGQRPSTGAPLSDIITDWPTLKPVVVKPKVF